MTRKLTMFGSAIALIAGLLLVFSPLSSMAFDEKNPYQPSVQDQWKNQQEQNPYQNIPRQQGSDFYPSRDGSKPGDKKEKVIGQDDEGWNLWGRGICRLRKGGAKCGFIFQHKYYGSRKFLDAVYDWECSGAFKRNSCGNEKGKLQPDPSKMEQ